MQTYEFFVLVGMLSAGFGWILNWLKTISKSLSDVDKRLARLEGRFEERGYWESRQHRETGIGGKDV